MLLFTHQEVAACHRTPCKWRHETSVSNAISRRQTLPRWLGSYRAITYPLHNAAACCRPSVPRVFMPLTPGVTRLEVWSLRTWPCRINKLLDSRPLSATLTSFADRKRDGPNVSKTIWLHGLLFTAVCFLLASSPQTLAQLACRPTHISQQSFICH